MKRFLKGIIFSLILTSMAAAQSSKHEKIADLNQLFNRCNWRIRRINSIVSKWPSDNDYRLVIYELEKLSALVQIAQDDFEPETGKEKFTEVSESLKETCAKMIGDSKNKNHEQLKQNTNSLFKEYTEFKLRLQDKPIRQTTEE